MANTNVQRQVHEWIRNEWLPQHYGKRSFLLDNVPLTSGGTRSISMSDDGEVLAAISTSQSLTATGKLGSGKLHHIFTEAYFLLLMDAKKKAIILTDPSMHKLCLQAKSAGLIPLDIQFDLAELPVNLAQRLDQSRRQASREVSPIGGR